MMDRKKTIATLKDILNGEQPITALDEEKKDGVIIYIKRDGKFIRNGKEVTEAEYNESVSKPNVMHINVTRSEEPTRTLSDRQMKLPDGTLIDLE